MFKYSVLLVPLVLTLSCSPSTRSSQQDSLSRGTDTLVPDTLSTAVVDTSSKQTDTITPSFKKSASLRNLIEYTREEWKNVSNPFTAVYTGCNIGDYFHLNFEDAQGKSYDFGFGNNNYGDILLFDTVAYDSNRKYVGRTFRIHWTWKISKFPCCDGEYDNVEAYYPSITKLEVVSSTQEKK
jgi:hypothetical protein